MKKVFGCLFSIAILGIIAAAPAFSQVDLGKNINWRVFNVMPATTFYWDINKAQSSGNTVEFPIQPFVSETSGSFAVYLLANYNYDITGKTFSTDVSWIPGVYKTRSTAFSGAYVRFWFQDVTSGPYDMNDYWWSTSSLDLNTGGSGSWSASLDRAGWTNLCGKAATDTTVSVDCMTGTMTNLSPYDGFTRAMKNVKQLGLSFGSSGSYASGVAITGDTAGTFTVNKFTVE